MIKARLRTSGNLLAELPESLCQQLFASVTCGEAPAGRVLFSAGDKGDGVYKIESGLIKIVMGSPCGGERMLAILGNNAIFGELALIDGQPRSASAVVLAHCTYSFVSTEAFKRFTQANPDFYRELVLILAGRLRETDKALAATTFLSVRGRVARALLDLADHIGRKSVSGSIMLTHKISNGDIAALAGVARENVSRLLGEWRERKLVTQSDRYHNIHDLRALEQEME